MIISDSPRIFWFLDEFMQTQDSEKLKKNLIDLLKEDKGKFSNQMKIPMISRNNQIIMILQMKIYKIIIKNIKKNTNKKIQKYKIRMKTTLK